MNNLQKTNFDKMSQILAKFSKFAIYSHTKTDVDAIGSTLALKKALENMGKTAHIFIDSLVPENAQFLDGIKNINNEKLSSYEVAIVLDCCDVRRLGRNQFKYYKNTLMTINIDHHVGNEKFCKLNILFEGLSSTCEILYELFTYLKIDIDREIAEDLLSGLLTDTGCLKYNSVTPTTLKVAAKLLEKTGKAMDEFTGPLFNSITREAFELIKLSLNKLEFIEGGKAGIILISAQELESVHAKFEDTAVLRDVPMKNKDLKILLVATENPKDGIYYASVRSKGLYSARNIAMDFGGGGHQQASGFKKDADPSELRKLFIESIRKELNKF